MSRAHRAAEAMVTVYRARMIRRAGALLTLTCPGPGGDRREAARAGRADHPASCRPDRTGTPVGDGDVAAVVADVLAHRGVEVHLGADPASVQLRSSGQVDRWTAALMAASGDGACRIDYDVIGDQPYGATAPYASRYTARSWRGRHRSRTGAQVEPMTPLAHGQRSPVAGQAGDGATSPVVGNLGGHRLAGHCHAPALSVRAW
jgi:hypothetical protein